MKDRAYLNYLNNFRGFAMLLIVAVHTIYVIADAAPRQFNILQIALANSSVLFIFISGYLFQYLINDYKYGTYLLKKFKNVILPYLIMSIPAIYILIALGGSWLGKSWIMTDSFMNKPVIIQILLFYVTGSHLPPFWFIPMISIIYLISPLLHYLDRHPNWYFIIPVLLVVSLLVGRPPMNDNPLQSFVFFLPVYLLGMHTSHFSKEYFSFLAKNLIILLIAFAVLTGLTFVDEASFSYLQKILLTFLCLFMFSRISSHKVDAVLGLIAKYSFGIFFIHKYSDTVIAIIYSKLGIGEAINSGMPGLIFTYILIVGLSILLLWPVKIIFRKKSRLLIGC